MLDFYAREKFSEQRKMLADVLGRAAARLGPPTAQMDLGDAAFLASPASAGLKPGAA